MKIAVTGHRPNKLWGYDYSHPQYIALGKRLRDELIDNSASLAISGMALGVDTVFALVALKASIPLECAIPCLGHSSKWQSDSVTQYNSILQRATIITFVTHTAYSASCMQLRNEYMVDNCDVLIAVWDGTSGGTANCIKYAQSVGKKIVYINPQYL